MQEGEVSWEDQRCHYSNRGRRCKGIVIGDDGRCFAHTTPGQRNLALAKLHEGEDLTFARGVPLTEELLAQILQQAPVQDGHPVLRNADFTLATFRGDAWFEGTTFSGDARFRGATFSGDARFSGATFSEDAWFPGASFGSITLFRGATFRADAMFHTATFRGAAWFPETTFRGNVWFLETTFRGDARFNETTFEKARSFGPLVVLGELGFDETIFSADVDIHAAAKTMSCRKTRFRDEVNFRLRWADVTLEDADFASACFVDRAPSAFEGLDESKLADGRKPEGQPRIVSVRRANVATLLLADVDLEACRFAGAHKLDGLRVESKRRFADRPQGWARQLGWPPLWRWTVRRVIAEEHEWRYNHERGIRQKGWYPDECQPPAGQDLQPLPAADIQNIYRDLRKGREDSKDEPGAADFYYGEMEMRRAATPWSFEKLLLWLYWLVSGYGLRASRGAAFPCRTVLFCSVAMNSWGLPEGDDRDFAEMLVFGLQSTTSLLRAPDVTLTLRGQVIQIALRLLGPLFFGLGLLSLRGRVRR